MQNRHDCCKLSAGSQGNECRTDMIAVSCLQVLKVMNIYGHDCSKLSAGPQGNEHLWT